MNQSELIQSLIQNGDIDLSKELVYEILTSYYINDNIKFAILIKYLSSFEENSQLISSITLMNLLIKYSQEICNNNKFITLFAKYVDEDPDDFVFTVMQKDEGILLLIWSLYYIQICGHKRILILDNGSEDPKTKNILKFLQSLGLKIVYRFNKGEHYLDKGNIILHETPKILGKYTNLIPVDIDEFIFSVEDEANISFYPEEVFQKIKNENERLNPHNTIIRIDKGFDNIPMSYDVINNTHKRCMLYKYYYNGLDEGLHLYDYRNKIDLYYTTIQKSRNLGYLHCHNRPYEHMLKMARYKLRDRVDVDNIEKLRNYNNTAANLKYIILNGKEGYENSLKRMGKEKIMNIEYLWKQCALPYPFV